MMACKARFASSIVSLVVDLLYSIRDACSGVGTVATSSNLSILTGDAPAVENETDWVPNMCPAAKVVSRDGADSLDKRAIYYRSIAGDAVLRVPYRSQGLIWDFERVVIFYKTEYPADHSSLLPLIGCSSIGGSSAPARSPDCAIFCVGMRPASAPCSVSLWSACIQRRYSFRGSCAFQNHVDPRK